MFSKNQLNYINAIKKNLGIETVWRYFEYLRIQEELGHTPTLNELAQNGGQTEMSTWAMAVGGLKELGFITKQSKVQTVEALLWESDFCDLLWKATEPNRDENGFGSEENKGRAEVAVKTMCDMKVKSCADKADVIRRCEEKTMEKINKIWAERFADVQDYPFDEVPPMQMAG